MGEIVNLQEEAIRLGRYHSTYFERPLSPRQKLLIIASSAAVSWMTVIAFVALIIEIVGAFL